MTDTAIAHRTLGGKDVTIRRVQGRAYFRAAALFMHTFGKALGTMLSGAGVLGADGELIRWAQLLGEPGPDGKRQGPMATEAGRDAVARLVGALLARFDSVDPERLELLAVCLIEGHVTIGGAAVTTIGTVDALLPGPGDYLRLVVAAVQHNLGPILAAGPTAVGSSAAATSPRPAATPSARPRRAG